MDVNIETDTSILLVVITLVGMSSCYYVRSLSGVQLPGAALQGPKMGLSQPATAATGDKAVTQAALQMARLCVTNLVQLQSGCPVVTDMRGRRPSPAQVCCYCPQ